MLYCIWFMKLDIRMMPLSLHLSISFCTAEPKILSKFSTNMITSNLIFDLNRGGWCACIKKKKLLFGMDFFSLFTSLSFAAVFREFFINIIWIEAVRNVPVAKNAKRYSSFCFDESFENKTKEEWWNLSQLFFSFSLKSCLYFFAFSNDGKVWHTTKFD